MVASLVYVRETSNQSVSSFWLHCYLFNSFLKNLLIKKGYIKFLPFLDFVGPKQRIAKPERDQLQKAGVSVGPDGLNQEKI